MGIVIGAGARADVVVFYDWKAEYFIQSVSKTNISISGGPGYHIVAGIMASGEDSFDGISIQGGVGGGLELGFSYGGNTNVIYCCPLNFKRHDKTLRNASKHGVADSFFKTKPP